MFHALSLRDYGRIDFAHADNRLYSRSNPNPDLHPHAMAATCVCRRETPDLIRDRGGSAQPAEIINSYARRIWIA